MYSYHSILDSYNLFSGVKLSITSFRFICTVEFEEKNYWNLNLN